MTHSQVSPSKIACVVDEKDQEKSGVFEKNDEKNVNQRHLTKLSRYWIVWLLIIATVCFNFNAISILIRKKEDGTSYLREHRMISHEPQKIIFVITPTYERPTQIVDLTQLSQTLQLVKGIHWIVIEDRADTSQRVLDLLKRSGILFTHQSFKSNLSETTFYFRGCDQRNVGLSIVSKIGMPDDIVYFADDDNAYDKRLFEEIRKTDFISTLPVGFTGHSRYQRCVVDKETSKIKGFATRWNTERKFMVDMAGFAFTVKAFEQSNARFDLRSTEKGFVENNFILQITDSYMNMQPLANNCTQILVWHVRRETPAGKGKIPWDYSSVPRLSEDDDIDDPEFGSIIV